MAYTNIDGVRIYYERHGQGAPLMMIHGASQDTLSWHDNIEHFADRYAVWALDLPGHGKSALIDGRPTRQTDEFAALIARFMETMDMKDTVLVGHSMGAAISIAASLHAPERIKCVVAVDGGAAFRGPVGVSYQPDMLRNTEINTTDWLETMFHSVLGRTTPEARRKEMAFDATRCSPYVAFSDLITYTSFNMNEMMDRVRTPIHYLMGEDDWSTTPDMARETSERLRALGVTTSFTELKGIGHIPHWEQPEAFNAALDEVLARA